MNLNSNDYKAMICARTDHIRMYLYPQQYGAAPVNALVAPEEVPDFTNLKSTVNEIGELIDAFETSIGPA